MFAGIAPADPPGKSKMFVHDMVLYGGKANLLGSEFADWLGSLWHGKRLAATIAVITLLVAGAFWYFGAPLPSDSPDDNKADLRGPEAWYRAEFFVQEVDEGARLCWHIRRRQVERMHLERRHRVLGKQ